MIEFPSNNKDDSEKSTGLLFMRTYNKWHGEIKRQLKALNITHPQFVIMTTLGYMLQFEEEVTQVMIAKMAGMDVMSASQIIKLLEKNRLISRKEHSRDTRAKTVTLTEIGQDVLKRALPIVENIDLQYFGSLGVDEKVFISLLHRLNQFGSKRV